MRFMITKEWRNNSLLRLILFYFLLFVLCFWVTDVLIFFHSMSFDPQVIATHYLGKKTQWSAAIPRSYKVMVEISHAHFAIMGIWLLTLAHLVLFVPISGRWKALLISACMFSGLINELSSWLIRYVHPGFAYLKIATYVTLQLSMLVILVLLFLALVFGWRNDYHRNEKDRR